MRPHSPSVRSSACLVTLTVAIGVAAIIFIQEGHNHGGERLHNAHSFVPGTALAKSHTSISLLFLFPRNNARKSSRA